MNYYNEYDPKAAAWLRELIKENLIPHGHVDERSICDVSAGDLRGYTQCHSFAGIGGWSVALALAGWPGNRPVWTASCPCQPFSAAGKGKGGGDDRHLWPVFHRLVSELKPERIFGEQVAQAIGFNWLDGISSDLEADGYAVGAVILGAHSVGAPHIRQRLYWVADAAGGAGAKHEHEQRRGIRWPAGESHAAECGGDFDGMADAGDGRFGGECHGAGCAHWAESDRPEHWSESRLIACRDGKIRRIPAEPAFFPLADGFRASRMAALRGAGNAIVPQVAAAFIKAFCEGRGE